MPKITIRPLTVLLVAATIALVVVGVIYISDTAAHLPGFFPGHATHSTKHHYKHRLAALTLAVFALVAAWFTTAPERSPD
jgi:H+/Cl- antiporter ClcA